jgi:hypothetical protein
VFDGEEAKKEHTMRRARKKDLIENETVAIWRERHIDNLWGAFLDVLKCPNFEMRENSGGNRSENSALQSPHLDAYIPSLPAFNGFEEDQHGVIMESADQEEEEIANDTSTRVKWNTQQLEQDKKRSNPESDAADVHMQTTFDLIESPQPNTLHPSNNNSHREHNDLLKRKRPKKTHSIPSFLDICRLVPTEAKAVEYLTLHKIFTSPKDTICLHCGYKGFRNKEKNNPKSLKCNRCNKSQSIAKASFFENSKASYRTILHLAAYWLRNTSREDTIKQLKCSSATITEFHRNFRKLIERSMDDELRAVALTADKRVMSQEIPKNARRSDLDEHYCVALWKEVHNVDLWGAFLLALRSYHSFSEHDTDNEGAASSVWVDEKRCLGCCKYHLKLHSKKAARESEA